jgi:hypothetical protein
MKNLDKNKIQENAELFTLITIFFIALLGVNPPL